MLKFLRTPFQLQSDDRLEFMHLRWRRGEAEFHNHRLLIECREMPFDGEESNHA